MPRSHKNDFTKNVARTALRTHHMTMPFSWQTMKAKSNQNNNSNQGGVEGNA